VSLLLQAEQKAMKISRRTDPNCISSRLPSLMQDCIVLHCIALFCPNF
jgi:hypothetical protein